MQNAQLPGLGDLAHGHSCFGHFLIRLLQCALYRTALEDYLKVTIGPESFQGKGMEMQLYYLVYSVLIAYPPVMSPVSCCN